MASERTYPLPVTIQATETGAKDQTYTVNLHPDTTTSELIQSLVPSLFGPDVNADLFMLFEAEVAIDDPEEAPLSDSTSTPSHRRKPQHIHRKLIRPLLPTELPYLFLLTRNLSPPPSSSATSTTTISTILYLKPHLPTPSPFAILRREQVKQLSEEAMEHRLADVEKEEVDAVEGVKERYEQLRRAVQDKLQELG